MFADDTSLFSKVYDIVISAKELRFDLKNISKWAFQWKKQFNPDPNKQANEVFFLGKQKTSLIPLLLLIAMLLRNHLGIVLVSKLHFKLHVDQKIKNVKNRSFKKTFFNVPRNSLLTIYKLFIRHHLDYGDILYDKPENQNFQNKFKKVQYRACLAINGAI